MRKIILLINFILIFTACSTNKSKADENTESIEEQISYYETLLSLRENSLKTSQTVELINDQLSYEDIIIKINMIRKPGIDFKEIDFSKNSILLINTEIKNSNTTDYEVTPSYNNNKVAIELKGINNPEFEGIPSNVRLIKLILLNKTSTLDQVTYKP